MTKKIWCMMFKGGFKSYMWGSELQIWKIPNPIDINVLGEISDYWCTKLLILKLLEPELQNLLGDFLRRERRGKRASKREGELWFWCAPNGWRRGVIIVSRVEEGWIKEVIFCGNFVENVKSFFNGELNNIFCGNFVEMC